MKKTMRLLCIIAGFCFVTATLGAQNRKLPHHILKVSLTDFYLSTLTTQFEKVVNDRLSMQLGTSATYQYVSLWDNLEGIFSGFALVPEIRYYGHPYHSIMVEPIAPVGIYASVWGRYEKAGLTLKTASQKADLLKGDAYAGGILFGWQFWLKVNKKPRFLLDFNIGGGYRFTNYTGRYAEKGTLIAFKQKGFLPKLSFSAGIPF